MPWPLTGDRRRCGSSKPPFRIGGGEERVVPPSMWPQIRRRLEGDDEPAEPVEEEEADVLDPGDDAFEPDDDFDELEH